MSAGAERPAAPASRRDLALPAGAATLVFVRHGESTYVAEGRFQGRLDPPLSALGERQAALVAERLARRNEGTPLPIPAGPPIGVWHSPLRRAADTARALARAQPAAVPLHLSDELTEIAQGAWEGVPAAEVRARWPAELAAWRQSPTTDHAPGGEPVLQAAARVRGGLLGIVSALAAAVTDRQPAPMAAPSGPATPESADAAAAAASLRFEPVPGYPSLAAADGAPLDPWAVVVAHDGIFRLALMTLLDVPYERFWSFPFNLAAVTVVALNDGVATLRAHNLSEHLAPLAEQERAAAEARGDRRGAL
jgi:broad specificity phosphatase PhoE